MMTDEQFRELLERLTWIENTVDALATKMIPGFQTREQIAEAKARKQRTDARRIAEKEAEARGKPDPGNNPE